MKPDQESKSLSQTRFGQFAENYITSQSHAQGSDLDRLVEIASPQADWLVLDVATGGGHTALKFAPHVQKVIASDITSEMLAVAEKFIREKGYTNVVFEQAAAENLPFEDGFFDLVTCRIAPHHFSDCAGFIRKGHRVLKPGGLLLVQDHLLPEDQAAARFIDNFERLRDPSHHRAFSHSEWIRMFEQAGLQVIHTEEIIKHHELLPWAERQGCLPETLAQLREVLRTSPPLAAAWLLGSDLDTPEASFANHHLLIAGRKQGHHGKMPLLAADQLS
jgi:ubiquinone/menaquinone biosynthesis C-methylase UbiE